MNCVDEYWYFDKTPSRHVQIRKKKRSGVGRSLRKDEMMTRSLVVETQIFQSQLDELSSHAFWRSVTIGSSVEIFFHKLQIRQLHVGSIVSIIVDFFLTAVFDSFSTASWRETSFVYEVVPFVTYCE